MNPQAKEIPVVSVFHSICHDFCYSTSTSIGSEEVPDVALSFIVPCCQSIVGLRCLNQGRPKMTCSGPVVKFPHLAATFWEAHPPLLPFAGHFYQSNAPRLRRAFIAEPWASPDSHKTCCRGQPGTSAWSPLPTPRRSDHC